MLKRVVKIGIGIGVIGSSVAVLQSNQWDVSITGIARFGRAAVTVRKCLNCSTWVQVF